jgi:hypothetical protein
MRAVRILRSVLVATALGAVVMNVSPAVARCYTFQESHNGTDLFNPDGGAKTAATIKLNSSVEQWQQKKGIKKVRMGKVTIKCKPWNMDYILPHHRCYARARVCY